MAGRELSRTRSRTKAFTPRKRRMRSLPDKPGTTIHFVSSDVAVVLEQKAGGAGGGQAPAKVLVCKCTKTGFKCSTDDGLTICREECIQWECTEVSGGLVVA